MEKELLFEDRFEEALEVGYPYEKKNWTYMEIDAVRIGGDEFIVDEGDGFIVYPEDENTETDEPAFSTTAPGSGDSIKWAITVNHKDADGRSGIEAPAGKVLHAQALIGGTQYGTAYHPFGDAVSDPEDDLRLGVPELLLYDSEHRITFAFALTNSCVYALYARGKCSAHASDSCLSPGLSFAVTESAAFTYAIPLTERTPSQDFLLGISYAPDENEATWYIDHEPVLTLDRIGTRIDREFMYIDRGGTEEEVVCRRFECGLALVSMLDGARDGGPALVNLTGEADYYDPAVGYPVSATFVDDTCAYENRIFGQGAELRCGSFSIYLSH